MKKFFAFLKNRGFTLVEALVATIIAGYCILPIMGTLQSGIERTQGFDHKEKLRLLARSRLNKELSVGAFDHTAIDTTTTYHYIYYNSDAEPKLLTIDTNLASGATEAGIALSPLATGTFLDPDYSSASSILYSYKVSVAVKENLKLGTSTANIKSDFVSGVSGLKAVTVMAELEPNDNVVATDSISLFSLLNIPSFSEDYIWISNPKNVEIIAIDPISRTRAESFLLPLDNNAKPRDDGDNDTARPWNIAVHPSRKFIAIQCKQKIKALNIDRSSPDYGKCKEIWPQYKINSTDYGSAYGQLLADVKKDDKNKAVEDKGIVFRPDGKFCYVTAHKDMKIFSFVASNTENWENLALINKTEYLTNKEKNTVLHAGNDGYLYVGPKDANMALRFPMFAPAIFANPPQQITDASNKNILALDTTSDGQEFYILWADNIITRHSSATGAKIAQTVITPTPSGICSDIKLSGDGRYLGIIDAGSGADKGGFFLLNLSTNPIDNTNLSLTNAAIFKKADPNNLGKKEKIEYCIFVQQSNDFVFDEEKKPYMFAVDITGMNSNSYSSGIPDDRTINFASADKSQVAFVNRPVEYFVVGSNDGSLNYIEYVDLNLAAEINSTSRKPVDSLRIDLATTPVCIALTRSGEKMRVGYGPNRVGFDIFKTYQSTPLEIASGSANMYGVVSPNEDFSVDPNLDMFLTMEHSPSNSAKNGYWSNLPLPPGSLPTEYKNPKDVDFNTMWKAEDIETLNNGGILILYRNTSTNASMLEWIGKHQWGTNAGNYERFARWFSTSNKFPPHNSRNMALSADDRFLAIESVSNPNLIYIYDFARNNFGRQTQQDGLLIDYREENNNPWTFGKVMASCSFALSNPSLLNGIKLRDSHTASDSWLSNRTWPANYLYDPSSSLIGGSNHLNKKSANKRFIGYIRPPDDINILAIAQMDYSRLFLDFKSIAENPTTVEAIIEVAATLASDSLTPLQLDIVKAKSMQLKIACGNAVAGWTNDPVSVGDIHPTASDVADVGDVPQALYQSHRWCNGTLSYNFSSVPDGLATVRLHFNENWDVAFANDVRVFKIKIEGNYKETNFDIFQRAGGGNIALTLLYEDLPVTGGNGLQIDLEQIVGKDNPCICGIEIYANGANYMGLFSHSNPGETIGALTKTSVTPQENRHLEMAGWSRIASTSAMPFSFQPVFIGMFPLTDANNCVTSELVFSRDVANPILYVVEDTNDAIWCQKPGKPITRINLGSMNILDRQFLVSNDGQNLVYAREDTKEIIIADISHPETFDFNGVPKTQSSLTGFGRVKSLINTQGIPQVLANMPFNTLKSTPRNGSYEFVATLSISMCGVNNAAVASGGIYILGGSTLENAAATNTIFCFNPLASPSLNLQPLIATLPRAINMHSVVAYDDEIYTFNGYDGSIGTITNLVQKYNPTTKSVMAFQEPVTGATTEFLASIKMTGSTSPTPYSVTDNGTAAVTGEEGWRVFDGDTSYAWSSNANYKSVTYNFGSGNLAGIVNKLWLHNATTDATYGIATFSFEGYNGSAWTTLTTARIPKSSTGWIHKFTNNQPYQQYRFNVISNHGSSSRWALREMRFYNKDVRKISPTGMSGYTKDGITVSSSADGGGAAWKCFDNQPNTSNEWDTNRTVPASGEYISMNLGTPDNINVVRIICGSGSDKGAKNFKFQGSNVASPGTAATSTDWTTFSTVVGLSDNPVNPNNGVWNTYYFDNTSTYQHYRLLFSNSYGDQLEVWEIEYYTTQLTIAAAEQTYLTKTVTDNLAPVRVKENSACMTPYGIVIAGGVIDNPRSTATTTCLVYWPHGYDMFNSNSDFSLGISRSLPNLLTPVADHVLVWHKGFLYRVCGATATGSALTTFEKFDFDDNQWSNITPPTTVQRHKAAVCSHGDEIFIFGGRAGGSDIKTAYAWNPVTNTARQLPDVPKTSAYAMTAVSCGSFIYLIGGSDSGTSGPSTHIIKYTP